MKLRGLKELRVESVFGGWGGGGKKVFLPIERFSLMTGTSPRPFVREAGISGTVDATQESLTVR